MKDKTEIEKRTDLLCKIMSKLARIAQLQAEIVIEYYKDLTDWRGQIRKALRRKFMRNKAKRNR